MLLTTVFCTADDLLPDRQANAARRVTDAEVVTLCVAQATMGIASDRRVLAVADKRLGHLFSQLPQQPGYFKRRRRLADTLEWLLGIFASQSPGLRTTCCSSTAARLRARKAARPSGARSWAMPPITAGVPATAAISGGFGCTRSFAPDGTPRALELTSPKIDERDVTLALLARCDETLLGDKGYAGRAFAIAVSDGVKSTI